MRRHSMQSPFTHQSIPSCHTSHPDDPIPHEPSEGILEHNAPRVPHQAASSTSQSSGLSGDSPAWSEGSTSDSEAPSTPPDEPLAERDLTDLDKLVDGLERLPTVSIQPGATHDVSATGQKTSPDESPKTKRRRASTQLIAQNASDIQRLLGSEATGTTFLQKFCCGGGCCMAETVPPKTAASDFAAIQIPDNEAFRSLGLKLEALTAETPLTKTVEVPVPTVSLSPLPSTESPTEKSSTYLKHPPEFVQPHPPYSIFAAPLHNARFLTNPGAEKQTIHFDLDVTDYPVESGTVDFKVGGAVGVTPSNDPAAVEEIFDTLGIPKFLRDKPIQLNTQGGRWPTIWGDEQARQLRTTIRELLTWCTDITSTPPTKQVFRLLAQYATSPAEQKILLYLCSAQGQGAFCDLRTSNTHITLLQLLHAFPSSRPPLEQLFGVLGQLMPRFYSLSNDPHVSSTREGLAGRRLIEIAVTVHETVSYTGSNRTGVGSGHLERIAMQFIEAERAGRLRDAQANPSRKDGDHGRALRLTVPMFRGLMANPLSQRFAGADGPMMLIGAGVGMAPFRGFILNRLRNANCANKIWLVQGVRDSALDELYAGELGDRESEIKRVVQSRAATPAPADLPPALVDDLKTADLPALVADLKTAEAPPGEAPVISHPPPTPEGRQRRRSAVVKGARGERKVAKYVQDEVRLQADVVWFVINALDGRIFVCGSTKGMGEGVESALVDVVMDKGGMNEEEAREFWRRKREGGQYIAETW
ncbi:hypothetical protein LTR28_010444 [Elasticomyces elasticus]|nr:hypothetical protein LTR28_010444 [Elasticomyces elasticus]